MKKAKFFIFFLVISLLLATPVFADDVYNEISSSIKEELDIFKNSLPDFVLELIPKEVFDGDFSSLSSEVLNEKGVIDIVLDFIFSGLVTVLKSFVAILVLLIISSLFSLLCNSFDNSALKNTLKLTTTISISLTVFNLCVSICKFSSAYLQVLCRVLNAFLPIMSTLGIMSGNVSSTILSATTTTILISVVDSLLIVSMLPLVKVCLSFSIIKPISNNSFAGISKTIRTIFTSVTVFIMSIFMFIFSSKNVLSQGADSLSIKTVRFAISSFVPIVGASINDALRTVSTSLGVIKNSCGILGIIVIALIMLPVIINLVLNKLSFSLLSSISKAIGCENEGEVLSEADSTCTFLLTLIACSCVLFIFALAIFMNSYVEVGV